MTRRTVLRVATLVLFTVGLVGSAAAGGDWNDSGIAWRSLDDGLAQAKQEGKPICLVIYADWCPHCTNYSQVFHDPKVVETSKRLVMVRLDGDKFKELTAKYAPDGMYVPRTLFLSPDGAMDASIHAPRAKYLYFYDEHDPASVLAGMNAALAR